MGRNSAEALSTPQRPSTREPINKVPNTATAINAGIYQQGTQHRNGHQRGISTGYPTQHGHRHTEGVGGLRVAGGKGGLRAPRRRAGTAGTAAASVPPCIHLAEGASRPQTTSLR
eukprot:117362-Chlamydomonas_euryale.AAC.2